MKKSSAVPATFCALVGSLLLEGCSRGMSVRRCIDPITGRVLPDSACSMPVVPASPLVRYGFVQRGTERVCMDLDRNIQVPNSYCYNNTRSRTSVRALRGVWGYDGRISNGRVTGYSSMPRSGADIGDSSGRIIQRGGFGSSGRSSGGWFS